MKKFLKPVFFRQFNLMIDERIEQASSDQTTSAYYVVKEFVNGYADRVEQDALIVDYIMKIDAMSTNEFCKEFGALPPGRNDAGLTGKALTQELANQFITLDAIKYRLIKDYAKEIRRTPNEL